MQPFKYNPNFNSGSFRNKITIQSFNPDAVDSDGFPLPAEQQWKDLKTVWAAIKTLKGKEYYEAASVQAETTTRFIIRYTQGLDTSMRILYKNRIFDIQSLINDDEKNVTLTIITKEVIASE